MPKRVVVPSWLPEWMVPSSKTKQLLDEIITMEARIRELDEIAAKAARIKDEEERKRNAAKGKGYVTYHELRIEDDLYWASMKRGALDDIYNQQRKQNSRSSFGPLTNLEVATQLGTYTKDTAPPGAPPISFIWQQGLNRYRKERNYKMGGRTKRAKKAKRSHRHRHLKQRCRTRKH